MPSHTHALRLHFKSQHLAIFIVHFSPPITHLLEDAESLGEAEEEEEAVVRHVMHARGLSLQRGREEKETPRH